MQSIHLYNPKSVDSLAVIAIEPASSSQRWQLRLAVGPRLGELQQGTLYGPYTPEELTERIDELQALLADKGYLPSGSYDLLSALREPSAAIRGRAATRLAWVGGPDAVSALLAALPNARDDLCAIIDALGQLGCDTHPQRQQVIDTLRPFAERKLLSRRRSAVEALRQLDDTDGLQAHSMRTLQQLPPPIRDALTASGATAMAVSNAFTDVEEKRHGLVCDLLYELASPVAVDAVYMELGRLDFATAFIWRYVKSIYKRAALRHDYMMLGWLAHRIERQGRAVQGTWATVKSGYDGELKAQRLFSRKTQDYLRRFAWRYLRRLARYRPLAYPLAAAEALIYYSSDDAQEAKGLYGALASCYLLNRILYGGGSRLVLNDRNLKFRFNDATQAKPSVDEREACYQALWDDQPQAYLRLLGAAQLIEVHEFALREIQERHPDLLPSATVDALLPLLQAPYEPTVTLALRTLEQRFDVSLTSTADWLLVLALADSQYEAARQLGQRFMHASQARWLLDDDKLIDLLTVSAADSCQIAAQIVSAGLQGETARCQVLAPRVLALLTEEHGDAEPSYVETLASVCRGVLLDSLQPLLSTADLITMIGDGRAAVQAVAANLLSTRTGAAEQLGLEGLSALAEHDNVLVRQAGTTLLRGDQRYWLRDPSILLSLVESDWADTRAVALTLIEERYQRLAQQPSLSDLMLLLDSNQVDVQNRGRELTARYFSELEPMQLLQRLVQHPHPNMQQFVIELIVEHLPPGADGLRLIIPFCRVVVFDLWPRRDLKQAVLHILLQRGLCDRQQAAIAVTLLNDIVQFTTQTDFETALTALTQLQLKYPDLTSAVTAQASVA